MNKYRLRRAFGCAAIYTAIGWAQGIWASAPYAQHPSTNMSDDSISCEMLPFLVITAMIVGFVQWLCAKLRYKRIALLAMLALASWYWLDMEIYNSRIAGWSTFSFGELARAVAEDSTPALLGATLVFVGALVCEQRRLYARQSRK